MTSKRINESFMENFRQGFPVGKPPFGYFFLKDKENKIVKPKQLIQIPEQIEKIKQAYQLTIEGKTWKQICDKLQLSKSTYYSIIKNKFYFGMIEYKEQYMTSSTPPIITSLEYDQANQKIKTKKKWF